MHRDVFERIVRTASVHDAGRGFDVFGLAPRTLASVISTLGPLCERYFRLDSQGIENIPPEGPAILVANHGGFLPLDGALLCLDVLQRSKPPRIPRPIADHFVPRLPVASTWLARMGAVSGTRSNVRHLLERGELIVIFPEGVSGPAKPFRRRYTLQEWRVGFAELAIRYRAPVVPVAIIGAEEAWPLLAKIPVSVFGSPYVPVPASPLPLPSKISLRYGAPLLVHEGLTPEAADEPEVVATAAETVRGAVEALIADGLREREGVFV